MVVVASLRINDSQILDEHRALDGAFGDGHKLERTFSSARIALAQGKVEPQVNKNGCHVGLLGQDRVNCRMQGFCVSASFEINPRTPYPAGNIFWSDGQRAIQSSSHLFIAV